MKYIPTYVIEKFIDIDFNTLYSQGKKVILTDLDNTLIDYNTDIAPLELMNLRYKLKDLGFKIYIVSNNKEKRIKKFVDSFEADGYLANALKPFSFKINKFIKKINAKKEEIIFIGDQILTDIACSNNSKLDSILVKTISKNSQKFYTKINRLREKKILKKIKKIDIEKYQKIERFNHND